MLEIAVLYGCDLSQVFTPIILRLYQPHSLCEKGATRAAAKAALYVFLLTPPTRGATGSTGEHWTMEQVSAIMERHGLRCNPVKFWVAMNAVYSDLSEVAEKHGVGNEEFYADMAKSFWLCDRDAVEDKLGAYYENVVRH